jgi:hypothetical protein
MGNFALQKGPCNFLKLHISPWGNLFILLLCFFSPRRLYPFSIPTGGSSIQLLLFLPLSRFPFLSRQHSGSSWALHPRASGAARAHGSALARALRGTSRRAARARWRPGSARPKSMWRRGASASAGWRRWRVVRSDRALRGQADARRCGPGRVRAVAARGSRSWAACS